MAIQPGTPESAPSLNVFFLDFCRLHALEAVGTASHRKFKGAGALLLARRVLKEFALDPIGRRERPRTHKGDAP